MPAKRIPKEYALRKKTIQFNGPNRVSYLVFDIDREFAGLAWEEANLPIPNLICTNPQNGHAHLVWEITDPVYISRSGGRGDAPPVRYLKAVQRAMGKALRADVRYTGLLTKNPLHPHWRVSYGRLRPYTLGELSEHLELTQDSAAELRENYEGRNCTLFDSGRLWAYRNRNRYDRYDDFREDLDEQIDRLNGTLSVPLGLREITGIVKSISAWVWNYYTGSGQNVVRRGIMALQATDPLRVKQQLGQRFTSTERSCKTLNKIRRALETLIQKGTRISKTAVAQLAKLHRNTVRVYWSQVTSLLPSGDTLHDTIRVTEGDSECLWHESSVGAPAGQGGCRPPGFPEPHPTVQSSIRAKVDDLMERFAYRRPSVIEPPKPAEPPPRTLKTPLRVLLDKIYEQRTAARPHGCFSTA